VTSDLSYARRYVWIQQRDARGAWLNVQQVYLDGLSRARAAVRLTPGRSLRALLPASQAGPGYVQSVSPVLP